MGLFIRTIGIASAPTKIGMADIVYNIKRALFLRRVAKRSAGVAATVARRRAQDRGAKAGRFRGRQRRRRDRDGNHQLSFG